LVEKAWHLHLSRDWLGRSYQKSLDEQDVKAGTQLNNARDIYTSTETCVELRLSMLCQINGVVGTADDLVRSNHYASEKIRRHADSLAERRDFNRQRAQNKLSRLKDFLHLQKFLQVGTL